MSDLIDRGQVLEVIRKSVFRLEYGDENFALQEEILALPAIEREAKPGED